MSGGIGGVTLLLGDCAEVLQARADGSVDAVVTDPPYGLGFMGNAWDVDVPADKVFRECLRVLKPGGHLLAFGGSRTYHRLACAVEDAGFEIRDQIQWVYGSGFPKSRNIGAEVEGFEGWGTALKPAHEPIVVARKPLAGTVATNVAEHGTGALNVDACRVQAKDGRPKRVIDPKATANGAVYAGRQSAGAGFDGGSRADGTTTLGRWPANLVHDGSDEVVAQFPAEAGAARFFYCAKATREDRNAGCEHLPERALNWSSGDANPDSFQSEHTRREVSNHHPTVKPTELMRWLCRLVTPPGGTVLDPFMGSGSTGRAAVLEGFRFVGIELDPAYLEIAEARIRDAARQPSLFASTPADGEQP